jgi:hypothetical protein
MRHPYVGSTFMDASSSRFFLDTLGGWTEVDGTAAHIPDPAPAAPTAPVATAPTAAAAIGSTGAVAAATSAPAAAASVGGGAGASGAAVGSGPRYGAALGPQWVRDIAGVGAARAATAPARTLLAHSCEVVALRGCGPAGCVGPLASGQWVPVGSAAAVTATASAVPAAAAVGTGGSGGGVEWPLYVRLSTGMEFGCDLVVRAGVQGMSHVGPLGLCLHVCVCVCECVQVCVCVCMCVCVRVCVRGCYSRLARFPWARKVRNECSAPRSCVRALYRVCGLVSAVGNRRGSRGRSCGWKIRP